MKYLFVLLVFFWTSAAFSSLQQDVDDYFSSFYKTFDKDIEDYLENIKHDIVKSHNICEELIGYQHEMVSQTLFKLNASESSLNDFMYEYVSITSDSLEELEDLLKDFSRDMDPFYFSINFSPKSASLEDAVLRKDIEIAAFHDEHRARYVQKGKTQIYQMIKEEFLADCVQGLLTTPDVSKIEITLTMENIEDFNRLGRKLEEQTAAVLGRFLQDLSKNINKQSIMGVDERHEIPFLPTQTKDEYSPHLNLCLLYRGSRICSRNIRQ